MINEMDAVTKAMVLAAGFGTRLKPLTLKKPKALIEVNGVPMIERVIKNLAASGIKEIVVNAHHLADQMEKYFSDNDLGVKVDLVVEKDILGTGGGIKNASQYLKDTASFVVHNVDVLCDLDIQKMFGYHLSRSAFVTLAVQDRITSRPLLIDEHFNITGRKSADRYFRYLEPEGAEKTIGFSGIHIISSDIFHNFTETGFFDIFTSYFRLISEGKKILGYDIGKKKWKDLGNIWNLTDISAV
jgi:NDP-sugar pyrophosphorylase family protein